MLTYFVHKAYRFNKIIEPNWERISPELANVIL